MKTAVIYATMTGHSKKIATSIAQELGCAVKNIKDYPIVEQIDTLFIVGGVYGNQSRPELLTYVKTLSSQLIGKVILVTSSAGGTVKQAEVRKLLTEQGITVEEEEYTCRGSFLILGWGHPKRDEIKQAAAFAKTKLAV